jgi:hypothetical protein
VSEESYPKVFGNAGKDVKAVANEISALCRVFTQIGNTLKNGSEATLKSERLAGDLLEMCEELLKESRELLEVLRPLVALSESHYKKAILRIQWLFQKSKFAAHKESLGLLQGTLTLLFSGMNFALAVETTQSEATR